MGTDTGANGDQKSNRQPNQMTQASDISERTKAMTAMFRSSAFRIQLKEYPTESGTPMSTMPVPSMLVVRIQGEHPARK